jgi:hypothetical protein
MAFGKEKENTIFWTYVICHARPLLPENNVDSRVPLSSAVFRAAWQLTRDEIQMRNAFWSFPYGKKSHVHIKLFNRYSATNRHVTGLIPVEVIGFFKWHNTSRRTMSLGSTQPLTERSTRNLPVVKGGQRVRLTNSPPFLSRDFLENVGASTSHNPMGLHGLLQG